MTLHPVQCCTPNLVPCPFDTYPIPQEPISVSYMYIPTSYLQLSLPLTTHPSSTHTRHFPSTYHTITPTRTPHASLHHRHPFCLIITSRIQLDHKTFATIISSNSYVQIQIFYYFIITDWLITAKDIRPWY